MNKDLAIIFVTETKDGFPSDDLYIKAFVSSCYREHIRNNDFAYRFIHMDGITNYNSEDVEKRINSLISYLSYSHEVFVVYVVDRDRKTRKQTKLLNKIETYILEKGHYYRLIINAKDIEDVFGQKIISSKFETAKNYKQESDLVYKDKKFHSQSRWVLTAAKPKSNIGRVLRKIDKEPRKRHK